MRDSENVNGPFYDTGGSHYESSKKRRFTEEEAKRVSATKFTDAKGETRYQPCPLCLALQNERKLESLKMENEMGDGDWFYILPTKNSKGHKSRFQVINKLHGFHSEDGYPTPKVAQDGMNLLFQFMYARGEDFAIMEPAFASIKDHWHLVATSLDSGEDDAQVAKTPRVEVRFKRAA